MKLLIDLFTPLLLHILANGFFIPMTSYGTDKRAFRPKFSTPQLLLHRRHPLKNLSGGQTFDHPDHFRWTRAGHRLDQEMHMIFVCANLSKGDLIAFGDVQADVFEHRVDLRVKDDTSILGRTHDVVDQCRDIVPLMTIVAHNSDNTISEKAEASFEESDPQRIERLGERTGVKPISRATHNREHITHSRVRLALSHNTDKRVVHFSSVCPLRSGMGPPSPAPLRLRG